MSLALIGGIETLHSYHKSFMKDENLGFEEITEEMLWGLLKLQKLCGKDKGTRLQFTSIGVKAFSMKVVRGEYFKAIEPKLCNR